MPLIRKVIDLGTCKAVSLPKGWLDYLERETGSEILEVAVEVDKVLTISPIIQKKEEAKDNASS